MLAIVNILTGRAREKSEKLYEERKGRRTKEVERKEIEWVPIYYVLLVPTLYSTVAGFR